jgi:hypothetical protein
MLIRIITPALLAVAMFGGCDRSAESKLVGTWNIPVIDAVTRVTYKSDHTCEIWSDGMGGIITDTADWHVEGDQIITRYKGKESKMTIVKLTRNELQIKEAGEQTVFTYTRVK